MEYLYKVVVWPESRVTYPFQPDSETFPNWTWCLKGDSCALLFIKRGKKRMWDVDCPFACTHAMERVPIVSLSPLSASVEADRKIDAPKKYFNSRSISSFAAITIKTTLHPFSKPNSPLDKMAVQSHQHDDWGRKSFLPGWLWHSVSFACTDYMAGQVIDQFSVRSHWMEHWIQWWI